MFLRKRAAIFLFNSHLVSIAASPFQNATRVALVVNGFGFLNPSSGIATAYAALAEALHAHGQQVTVLYASESVPAHFPEAQALYRAKGVDLVLFVQCHNRLYIAKNTSRLPNLPFPMHANSYQRLSYAAYRWAQSQNFDVMHFHALGGLGYYALAAKRQGLALQATQLVVGVHAIPGSEMKNIDSGLNASAPTFDNLDLVQDFMQQRSAELAVCSIPACALDSHASGRCRRSESMAS